MTQLSWSLFPVLLALCCGIPLASARFSPETMTQLIQGATAVSDLLGNPECFWTAMLRQDIVFFGISSEGITQHTQWGQSTYQSYRITFNRDCSERAGFGYDSQSVSTAERYPYIASLRDPGASKARATHHGNSTVASIIVPCALRKKKHALEACRNGSMLKLTRCFALSRCTFAAEHWSPPPLS